MSNKALPIIPDDFPNERLPIFVVDDSQDNLDLMEALLISEGFENIYLARSGPEALEFLETHDDVGVILLDMMMPGMDGHQVCRLISTSERWGHIPVIIVTGGALRHNEALQKSFAAGAIDFVTKPINEVDLLMRVRSALALYRERVIRHHKTAELAESEEKFRITFDQAPVGIAHIDIDGRLLLINRRLPEMLGYSHSELMSLSFQDLCDDSNRAVHNGHVKRLRDSDVVYSSYELPLLRKDRQPIWTRLTLSPLRDPSGGLKYFIYIIEDITEQKTNEENMRLAATVFDGTTEAIIVTDAERNILKVNSAFTDMTGYTCPEISGKNPRFLKSGKHNDEFYRSLWESVNTTGQWQGEVWNRRRSGDIYPTWLTLCAVKNGEGAITNYVGISRDITLRKEAEDRLNYQATHDALTGLPNRALFHDRLLHAIAHAKRDDNNLAILFLDLDRFKIINDTLGHEIGDLLLQAVVERLKACTRESDTMARWGGDEFIFLLEKLRNGQDAAIAARRILDALGEHFTIEGHEVFVTGSIGITLFPKDGEDVQILLKNSDIAMYRAKEKGKNDYQFYTSAMNAMAFERLKLESDLRRALQRDEFILHYQPRIDFNTGGIVGVEALVRWQQPNRELLYPKDFIPLSEETGLIVPIGEWVLKTACSCLQEWKRTGLRSIRISVNISTFQFRKDNLVDLVERTLKETGLNPDSLELEITESVMMYNMEKAIETLHGLVALGVRISMDDFGTGYSSLNYLKRFPISALKIDQSFVRQIPSNSDDAAIAVSIISLAKSLKLRVVAEGVETEEQLRFFRDCKCDEAQGFLFCRPVEAAKIADLLASDDPLGISRYFSPSTSAPSIPQGDSSVDSRAVR